jgi:hypothetical protein
MVTVFKHEKPSTHDNNVMFYTDVTVVNSIHTVDRLPL